MNFANGLHGEIQKSQYNGKVSNLHTVSDLLYIIEFINYHKFS